VDGSCFLKRSSLSENKSAPTPAFWPWRTAPSFRGGVFGSAADLTGELVFNTAMSGYQEC